MLLSTGKICMRRRQIIPAPGAPNRGLLRRSNIDSTPKTSVEDSISVLKGVDTKTTRKIFSACALATQQIALSIKETAPDMS